MGFHALRHHKTQPTRPTSDWWLRSSFQGPEAKEAKLGQAKLMGIGDDKWLKSYGNNGAEIMIWLVVGPPP